MKMAYSIKDDNHIPRNATYWKNQAKLIAEDREKMAYVLAITRSNILSLKHNSGIGVVVYDAWLNEVNMALGIIEND